MNKKVIFRQILKNKGYLKKAIFKNGTFLNIRNRWGILFMPIFLAANLNIGINKTVFLCFYASKISKKVSI